MIFSNIFACPNWFVLAGNTQTWGTIYVVWTQIFMLVLDLPNILSKRGKGVIQAIEEVGASYNDPSMVIGVL